MTLTLQYELSPAGRVSAGRTGEIHNSRAIHTVLPGSVIRGALGTAWWSSPSDRFEGPDGAARFRELFGGKLIVGFAVPERLDSTGHLRSATLAGMSAVRCKYPGPECPPGWHDLARDALADEPLHDQVRGGTTGPESVTHAFGSITCPGCGGAVEHGRGWTPNPCWADPAWTVSTTRTALANGVAATEKLFTRRAVREHTIFRGTVRIRTGDPQQLSAEIDWLQRPRTMYVGGQRSVLGKCRWSCRLLEPHTRGLPAGAAIVARLRSPAILIDEFGAPSTDLGRAVLDAAEEGHQARAVRVWQRLVAVSGWHGMSGTPKPTEWAIEAGSTVALAGMTPSGIAALSGGVGLRRLEGYGEVEILRPESLPTFTSPSAPDAGTTECTRAEPEGDTQPPLADERVVERTSLDEILATLARSDRPTFVNGMLAAARGIRLARESHFSAAFLSEKVNDALSLPWARNLAGDTLARTRQLLEAEDIGPTIQQLLREKGTTQ